MLLPHAILLGVIEGLTEFLPISSTAHMIIAAKLLAIPTSDALSSFEIIIQLGAIAAVIVLYLKKLLQNLKLIIPIIFAFIPTMLLGLLLYKIVKTVFLETFSITIVGLAVGGIYLVITEYLTRSKPTVIQLIESIPPIKAILIGISQSFAMVPGMSRSAMTISAGKLVGLSRENAVEFSFMLAVPVMISASALDIFKSRHLLTHSEWSMIGVGLICAFITALVTMKWFINYAKKHSLTVFGWYRIILSIVLAIFVR